MILSILIPSIPERKNKLDNLLNELNRQKKSYEVEILTSVTNKYIEGGLSVGAKRDLLVQKAKGKYLCFLDDDDYLSPDYLDSIIEYTKQNTDVITFKSFFKCDTYWSIVDMDLRYENEDCKEEYFKRCAWHVCPIRTNIAKTERFNDINYGEDWDWMQRILPKLTTHIKINKIIHQYNYSKFTSAVDEYLNTLK